MNHIKRNHDLFHSHRFSHPVLQLCLPDRTGIDCLDGEISKPEAMIEIKNAIIESADITNDDHGVLTAWLYLDYGGSGQGFGGFALYLPKDFTNHTSKGDFAGHFIFRSMEIAGVNKWKDMKGKTIRVKASFTTIESIGHIVKDDWFNPSEDFKNMSKP